MKPDHLTKHDIEMLAIYVYSHYYSIKGLLQKHQYTWEHSIIFNAHLLASDIMLMYN